MSRYTCNRCGYDAPVIHYLNGEKLCDRHYAAMMEKSGLPRGRAINLRKVGNILQTNK